MTKLRQIRNFLFLLNQTKSQALSAENIYSKGSNHNYSVNV